MARYLTLLIVLLLMVPAPALAAKDRVFSVEVDNDVLTPADQYFTNGVRVSVAFGEAAQKPWMDRLADKIPFLSKTYNERIISFALGQNIYTPADTAPFTLTISDRPYAGWLYGEFGIEVQTDQVSEYFIFQAGMIGPASLADRAQRSYHRLISVARPNGWAHQL
ncbi:MAG: lipid A deacylase LpxR family protein, partial [Proteobacteria bacterium]|nr:lipid A deacylase LpxR family protein [Pseudomonadota bacterium]